MVNRFSDSVQLLFKNLSLTVVNGDFYSQSIFGAILVFGVAIIMQIFFPPGTRTISRRVWIENHDTFLKHMLGLISSFKIDPKYLREYRCPNCNKLLAKGNLKHKDDILEVKCRGCSTIHMFRGEDADIIEKRSVLLKEGKIPDTELVK